MSGRRTVVFDLDGTLCEQTAGGDAYATAEPLDAVDYARRLHAIGDRIVVHTARGMSTLSSCAADAAHREDTERWLERHGVPCDELVFGKPRGDLYVDDRAVNPGPDRIYFHPSERGIVVQAVRAARARRAGDVALANGCFDCLHRGHLVLLREARMMAGVLIVAVNSDRSVRSLKGAGRPLQDEATRADVAAAVACADVAVVFDGDTPEGLICDLEPDVVVKGAEYEPSAIVAAGARVSVVPMVEGQSTTAMLERARRGGG